MTLFEILSEISVGYHQNDSSSEKLRNYVKEVIEALSEEGAIYEKRKLTINALNGSWETNLDGDTFLQGSYGTNTAIKHKLYEVDADIAFIIENDEIDLKIRDLIYNKLYGAFGYKYTVENKKPCITIDFMDKYKIDVAIYTKVNNEIYFHNCIDGYEKADIAKPKDLINYFNSCYADNTTRRKVVRLIKHFIKTTNISLDIQNYNKIPSISLNLLLCERSMTENANEDELYEDILESLKYIKSFVVNNGCNGPQKEELCVSNTFYKVKDISEVIRVIDRVNLMFQKKQYSQLVENDLYKKINERNSHKVDGSFTGTMG